MKEIYRKISAILRKVYIIDLLWQAYHHIRSYLAALAYGFPAKKLVVIGITGTKGKTTTSVATWHILHHAGIKTGLLSSAATYNGESFDTNNIHMTMPDAWSLQKQLKQFVLKGITHAVVEISSEGIKLGRHLGLYQDVMIYTNISPEHLPSHRNNFKTYRDTKARVFKNLDGMKRKVIRGMKIPKSIIYNQDADFFEEFSQFKADTKVSYGIKTDAQYRGVNLCTKETNTTFVLNGEVYTTNLVGEFNAYNILAAITAASLCGVQTEGIKKSLSIPIYVPGRMERIENNGFDVYVDYAHEASSMRAAVTYAKDIVSGRNGKVIVLLGAEGGGRDPRKRPLMGEIVGNLADFVVVCNVDPYDDDPKQIMEDIAQAAEKAGKIRNTNLFLIEDRRQGIQKALDLAHTGDFVLITGKGAEQSMIVGSNTIPWDDRRITKEILHARTS